ncbi:MAG: hypothetical protein RID59_22855 [Hoeflea sp.]
MRDDGKTAKTAIIAVARRLLIRINAMKKNGTSCQPKRQLLRSAYVMAEFLHPARPVARASASFKDYDRPGLFCHKKPKMLPGQPFAELQMPRH